MRNWRSRFLLFWRMRKMIKRLRREKREFRKRFDRMNHRDGFYYANPLAGPPNPDPEWFKSRIFDNL
ncbi:MAG: hypothetical protein A2359_04050 [Candidatus Moranbacteria bacterium RIFOXYB1_FULL_43_19]|nr:MAG: hypothetical protein A2359_04050 [Candidatus Moranbacteria bacterium RIFOXYB1_FULL_43_19]OGI28367.1 MAG: hypothetical protein A2184_03825 [Candidatus Moranbacteria bacterium RIFOXYA1_FULL_44_7]OGI34035.1 MAG: hypothetical protein A2420_02740 [Candidatus Moranbacteria bacterium RIFOXYC1_FULL_44_13]OGI37745.1 MAG: hypothetical protein A2612_03235 [Candidatus Moranbacteria bacterium RIFOXYD1_FULL_44_12]